MNVKAEFIAPEKEVERLKEWLRLIRDRAGGMVQNFPDAERIQKWAQAALDGESR